MIELVNVKQALTQEDFSDFAAMFGREIPLSFKNLYFTYNGGDPAEEDVIAGKLGLPVHGFNPIKYGTVTIEVLINDLGDIKPQEQQFGTWKSFSYIPFAYDAGANPIFLSLRDQDYGSVYIYDPDGGGMAKISSSFEEFLTRLNKG